MSRAVRRNLKKRVFEEPSVNLTPLIDVVFVILIMFILVAPLLELDRIELADAASAREEKKLDAHETSPITVHVGENNAILLNKRKVAMGELGVLLKQMKKNYPRARPQLFHDKRAFFGTYQSVKNAVEEAGFEQMDIILKPG
jgi:biopolymer transport protein ExbD